MDQRPTPLRHTDAIKQAYLDLLGQTSDENILRWQQYDSHNNYAELSRLVLEYIITPLETIYLRYRPVLHYSNLFRDLVVVNIFVVLYWWIIWGVASFLPLSNIVPWIITVAGFMLTLAFGLISNDRFRHELTVSANNIESHIREVIGRTFKDSLNIEVDNLRQHSASDSESAQALTQFMHISLYWRLIERIPFRIAVWWQDERIAAVYARRRQRRWVRNTLLTLAAFCIVTLDIRYHLTGKILLGEWIWFPVPGDGVGWDAFALTISNLSNLLINLVFFVWVIRRARRHRLQRALRRLNDALAVETELGELGDQTRSQPHTYELAIDQDPTQSLARKYAEVLDSLRRATSR